MKITCDKHPQPSKVSVRELKAGAAASDGDIVWLGTKTGQVLSINLRDASISCYEPEDYGTVPQMPLLPGSKITIVLE